MSQSPVQGHEVLERQHATVPHRPVRGEGEEGRRGGGVRRSSDVGLGGGCLDGGILGFCSRRRCFGSGGGGCLGCIR